MRHHIATLAAAAIILLLVASSTISINPAVDAQSTHPPATSDVQIRDGTLPGQSVVSWAIVPYATHYRIGYINMDDYAALVRSRPTASWRQTITFAELDASDIIRSDGRMEFTVQHLEPGVNYAFTVLTSNDAHWDADTVSGAFIWPKDPTWTTHVLLVNTRADDNTPVTPTPQPTPAPTATPQPTPTERPAAQTPTPEQLRQSARLHMLALINKARADEHLPPVSLGQNQAAQLHAQDMFDTCFISHWGSDGLKPHMRYTLTNGQQASSENVLLSGDCFNTVQIGTGLTHIQRATSAMHSFMASPGHRKAILNPHQSKVNIGIATSPHITAFVQQFEKNYNQFTALPAIQGSRLTFAGTANISTASGENIRLTATITYDPPPHALTTRQLASTNVLDFGPYIAFISIRPRGDTHRPDQHHEMTIDFPRYPDPYDAPAEPPLEDITAMQELKAAARLTSQNPPHQPTTVHVIRTDQPIDGANYQVDVDIQTILERHGNGVYTISLHARSDAAALPLSIYSIFHGVTPPAKYADAR